MSPESQPVTEGAEVPGTPQCPNPPAAGARVTPDLRERALREGPELLGDAELIALLLGTGAQGQPAPLVAAKLLASVGGLSGLARVGPSVLAAHRGLGPAKAVRLAAALELGRRVGLGQTAARVRIVSFQDVVDWAKPRLAGLEHEELWLLSLDGQGGLKSTRRIAQGGVHGCALAARDVLVPALRDAASAIVVVHNHPSGDPAPSREDVHMTRELCRACDAVAVPLLDHVVVARGGASSLVELGLLEPLR
ncbi:MAG TPA: DNA repair protein RadC [Polyangiaceae bacterium]